VRLLFALVAPLATTGCVDAIDQTAVECQQKMLPGILAEVAKMPSDASLRAGGAEITHRLEGGEGRLNSVESKIRSQWANTSVGPVDEITFGLFLAESAVGFRSRATDRVKQLCALGEANRIKYKTWRVGMKGFATHVSQSSAGNAVVDVAAE